MSFTTVRQQVAWDNPCVSAGQTTDQMFNEDYRYGGFDLMGRLTLNFGME